MSSSRITPKDPLTPCTVGSHFGTGTKYCVLRHGRCSCGSKETCAPENTNCKKCCTKSGHGHCPKFLCPYGENDQHYKHCELGYCLKPAHVLGNGDGEIVFSEYCEIHCSDLNHGHCQFIGCGFRTPFHTIHQRELYEREGEGEVLYAQTFIDSECTHPDPYLCSNKKHDHCTGKCISKEKHGDKNKCNSCCSCHDAGHCSVVGCDKEWHYESFQCVEHCAIKEHTHKKTADRVILPNKTYKHIYDVPPKDKFDVKRGRNFPMISCDCEPPFVTKMNKTLISCEIHREFLCEGCDLKELGVIEDCKLHCETKGHGHCSIFNCGDDEHCIKHCEEEGHGHCDAFGCTKDLTLSSTCCNLHCPFDGHGHCVTWGCDGDNSGSHTHINKICALCLEHNQPCNSHRGSVYCHDHCNAKGHIHYKS